MWGQRLRFDSLALTSAAPLSPHARPRAWLSPVSLIKLVFWSRQRGPPYIIGENPIGPLCRTSSSRQKGERILLCFIASRSAEKAADLGGSRACSSPLRLVRNGFSADERTKNVRLRRRRNPDCDPKCPVWRFVSVHSRILPRMGLRVRKINRILIVPMKKLAHAR